MHLANRKWIKSIRPVVAWTGLAGTLAFPWKVRAPGPTFWASSRIVDPPYKVQLRFVVPSEKSLPFLQYTNVHQAAYLFSDQHWCRNFGQHIAHSHGDHTLESYKHLLTT